MWLSRAGAQTPRYRLSAVRLGTRHDGGAARATAAPPEPRTAAVSSPKMLAPAAAPRMPAATPPEASSIALRPPGCHRSPYARGAPPAQRRPAARRARRRAARRRRWAEPSGVPFATGGEEGRSRLRLHWRPSRNGVPGVVPRVRAKRTFSGGHAHLLPSHRRDEKRIPTSTRQTDRLN